MAKDGWFNTFFEGIAVDLWLAAVPDEQTRTEVDFIEKALQLAPGARVLDVPCGGGRHSVELASRGHCVTGVDLSTDFLSAARTRAAERNADVAWERRDMRDLPWTGAFDGAFCFGNSFGYLDGEDNADFLVAVARTLVPGARFAMDACVVAESILPNLHERLWFEDGGIHLLIENRYDHERGRLHSDLTFVRDGQTEKRETSQRVYTYSQLCHLLTAAGFEDPVGYSSEAMEPYKLGSQGLLLVATRA